MTSGDLTGIVDPNHTKRGAGIRSIGAIDRSEFPAAQQEGVEPIVSSLVIPHDITA